MLFDIDKKGELLSGMAVRICLKGFVNIISGFYCFVFFWGGGDGGRLDN